MLMPRLMTATIGISCLCVASHAQTVTRITGTVSDIQGNAIVDAQVLAQNTSTGEERKVTSDQAGNYIFTSLTPGTYKVTVTAKGFSPTLFSEVRAGIGDTLTLNEVLKVAGASSEVTVKDVSPLIQSSSAEVGTTIDASSVSAMPLASRNFLQLASLAPGVTMPLNDNSALARNSPNFSVNGARTSQNNLQINGIDANDISAHDLASVAIPAPESISEVVIRTSMYDASVSGAGGNVQLVTKSGSNKLHGNVYEYFRDTSLNANDPNLKAVGLSRPVLRRNVYGATLGGPIRKDRAFYFLSYQGTRETNGATDQSLYKSVLIANGLTDDRSEPTLLQDFQSILPPGTASIDPTALALLNVKLPDGHFLIPTPQQNGRITGTSPSTYHEEQFNANVDFRLGRLDSMAGKFFFANAPEFWALGGATFSGGSSLPGFGTNRDVNNRIASLQWVHSLTSSTVNEARAGYNFISTNEVPQESVNDSDIGISRPTAGDFPGLPLILLGRDTGAASIGSSPITLKGGSPSLSLVDVLSLSRGNHSIRIGTEFRRYQWDANANVNAYGEIDFPTFDQFLLGNSDFSAIGIGLNDRNFRATDYNFFVQDDWKASRRFTLNLGLRYEVDLPPYDTKGRIGGFDPDLYKPRLQVDASGNPIGPPNGGIVMAGNVIRQYDLPGVPKVSKSVLKSIDPNNFGPRFGFAWSPTDSGHLVLRGGYGIFYSRPSFIYLGLDFFAPPFYATFLSAGQNFASPFPTSLPENQFPVLEPGVPLTASIMDRNNRTPYFQQFNTSFDYQFARDTALQIAYVGTRGVRLFRQVAINQARIASTNHPITNAVTGQVITSNTPENAALRAPFQGTDTAGFALNQTSAQSTYHSLQITLNHRMSHGLDAHAAYTFSNSIDDASNAGGGAFADGSLDRGSALDTGNVFGNQLAARANRGLSDFDRKHRLALDCSWDVPNFPWKSGSRILRAAASDWRLSGIVIAMSGLPIDIIDPAAGDLYGLLGARADWAAGANSSTAKSQIPAGYSFNPYAFALPVVQPNQAVPSAHDSTALAPEGGSDIGNLGRNVLRGPSQKNVDFSATKTLRIGEFRSVELKVDFFNVLNHPNHSNPVSDITAAAGFDARGAVSVPGDFGRSLSFDSSPRIIQLSVSYKF